MNSLYTPELQRLQREAFFATKTAHDVKPWENVHPCGSESDKMSGAALLSEGKAGCLITAGGQGSRLGSKQPKGLTPLTRFKRKSLFQFFCEKTKAASALYGVDLPLYIMTSPLNHLETVTHFEENNFFGLKSAQVFFFQQSLLPFLDDSGNWFLEKSGEIAAGPAGNAEALELLHKQNLLASGIDYLNVIPIDNPLADPFDTELIGLAHRLHAPCALKTVLRTHPAESMGLLAACQGKLKIIEYSELPPDTEGFAYSHTGQFCFSTAWIDSFYSRNQARLPFHFARKNGVWKTEQFIFDLLDYCENPAVLVCPRDQIYAPLKNATGDKSPDTVRAALLAFDRSVMETLSLQPPRSADFELDPAFYYPSAALKQKWKGRILDQTGYICSEE